MPRFSLTTGGATTLPAGAYRVYLVADRPATVRILMHGLPRNVTLPVTRRTGLTVSAGEIPVRREAARWAGHRVATVRGGPRSLVVTLLSMRIPERPVPLVPTSWGDTWTCEAPAGATACEDRMEPARGLAPEQQSRSTTQRRTGPAGSYAGPTTLFQHYAGSVEPVEALGGVVELTLA